LEQGDQKDLINIENNTISKTDDKEILNYFEIQKNKAEKEKIIRENNKKRNSKVKPTYK